MATTYELIAFQSLGSNAASVTFSNIPGTFTDLLLVQHSRTTRSNVVADAIVLKPNGSGSNGSARSMAGTGSSVVSFTRNVIACGNACTALSDANTFGSSECYIPNYAGSTNKSMSVFGVTERNNSATDMIVESALWSSTAAITSLELVPVTAEDFVSGSSFYLYGITKA